MSLAALAVALAIAVTGDAIPESLTGTAANPERGRAIVVDRQVGLCLLCHSGPFPEQRFQGDLAPDLRGVGTSCPRVRSGSGSSTPAGSTRRRSCPRTEGMRAETFPFGAPELVELEAYLMWRARGMKLESPAVRP